MNRFSPKKQIHPKTLEQTGNDKLRYSAILRFFRRIFSDGSNWNPLITRKDHILKIDPQKSEEKRQIDIGDTNYSVEIGKLPCHHECNMASQYGG
mmetsp:Transcript_21909/g.52131  ORF Transcript_21909/g.52131 Transcript_21909/m.52131 type:complete len:95 (+) Transcript_21909:2893-3177(+)